MATVVAEIMHADVGLAAHFALPVVVATQTLLHHLLPPVSRWKKQSAIAIGCLVAATLILALASL